MTDTNKPDNNREPEIRYVPVQFIEGYAPQSANDEVEIDLMDILKRIWDGRSTIIKITAVFVFLGVLYALGSPNKYTTTTKLFPEVQQTNNLGRFGGLAAQFGLGSTTIGATNDFLPPQIYPEILTSTDFLHEIIQQKVYFEEIQDSITVNEYYNDHQKSNLLIGYTIGLPFKLLRSLISEADTLEVGILKSESFKTISRNEMRTIRALSQTLEFDRDQLSGILTISVVTQSPEVTVQLSNHIIKSLSEYLISYRTEKSRLNLSFLEERQFDARRNFILEQERLADFRDQNQGNLTAAARTIEQNILSEYNVKFNVYNSLSEQLEQARIKLQEDTPVINLIQESVYPNRKSGPNRLLILILFSFFGSFIGVSYVLGKPFIANMNENFLK